MKCEELISIDKMYKTLQRDLRRYSVLQGILPEKNRRALILNHYEEIKNLDSSNRNPFFWVQYGIAKVAYHEFDQANDFSNTAYGIGKRNPHFNSYQIDNHYARLLLEWSIFEERPDYYEKFQEAHAKIITQMDPAVNKHYGFRVAIQYEKFYKTFFEKMSIGEQTYFASAVGTILNRVRRLSADVKANKHVRECERTFVALQKSLQTRPKPDGTLGESSET